MSELSYFFVKNIAAIRLLRLWFQVTYCQHCPWFRWVNR